MASMKTRRVFVTLELETDAELVRLNTTVWWQARLASGNDNTTCLQASANVARAIQKPRKRKRKK